MNKALLFDIDGTLLRVKGLGTLAYKESFREVLGHDIDMRGINWMGATDGAVLRSLLTKEGYSPEEIQGVIPRIFETYTNHFERITRDTPDGVVLMPQVHQLLRALEKQAIGILTGNILTTAHIKLKRAGLDHYFSYGVGAYASDSDIREDLLPIALERMSLHYQSDFSKAIIIGDSPRDIDVARAHGIPCLIVATGHMSYDELQTHKPDHLFHSFKSWQFIADLLIQ